MKLLKEPMLHFAIAGGLLFTADAMINRDEAATEKIEPIRIGEGELRWLRQTFANQWQRPPSHEELGGLVANLVEEELLAREARALGLDQGDTVVRRRLAQKLGFLIEDTARIADPTDRELREFYSAQSDRFRSGPRVSLNQIFFGTERRMNAEADAKAALMTVAATGQPGSLAAMGDSLLLEERFESIDRQGLSSLFGTGFADAVFELAPGSWQGPIRSSYGVHLVQVTRMKEAEVPLFEAIRASVVQEWRRDREKEIRSAYLDKLREKYGVAFSDGFESADR